MSDTMTSTIRSDLSRDLDALKKDLANMKQDFAGIATRLGIEAKDRVTAAHDSVQDAFKSSLSSAESCVRNRPFVSVLIAFGAGALAAKLLKR